ncbi:hypothetical protein M3Y94_00987200 [Aphelenchoides besseyi]|nr:hypothetical protein M3Y94_00987200 [Aphelenchoides besseyi]KAI6221115.1 hypothetical protein M3Y95_01006800 [Aphelenchoides besseyi]
MRISIVLLGLVGALAMMKQSGAVKCYSCFPDKLRGKGFPMCDSPIEKNCGSDVKGCLTMTAEEGAYNPITHQPLPSGMYKLCGESDMEAKCEYEDKISSCGCFGNLCNSSDRSAVASLGLFLVLFFVLA